MFITDLLDDGYRAKVDDSGVKVLFPGVGVVTGGEIAPIVCVLLVETV